MTTHPQHLHTHHTTWQVLARYGERWNMKDDQTLFHRLLVDRFVSPGTERTNVHATEEANVHADSSALSHDPPLVLDYFQEAFGNTGGRQFQGDLVRPHFKVKFPT